MMTVQGAAAEVQLGGSVLRSGVIAGVLVGALAGALVALPTHPDPNHGVNDTELFIFS